MKHIKFGKEEYVVLKKEELKDALYTAVTLTSMHEHNERMVAQGCGDPDFDVSTVTVGDVTEIVKVLSIPTHIVDRILESL